jgi:hypothetical protein
MATHDKLLWCPPGLVRLCIVLGGFAVFMGVSMTMPPRHSMAVAPQSDPARATAAYQSSTASNDAGSAKASEAWSSRAQPPLIDPSRATATIIHPQDLDRVARVMATPTPPPRDPDGNPLLGGLVGSDFHIWIYSGPEFPLYTVADARGTILAHGLPAHRVFEQFPQIPVTELRLQPYHPQTGVPIMYADPP